ncbi:MAG: STAS domain-containing protein [Rhodobacteraceae bacterium]|nr:STAS domain-containing protein [Paracoccaceae bacterium]
MAVRDTPTITTSDISSPWLASTQRLLPNGNLSRLGSCREILENGVQLLSESIDGALVICVDAPRIDAAAAVQFKDAMRAATQDAQHRVVLDLSKVDAIDSSGLGAIVTVMKHLAPDTRLELAGLTEKVAAVFRLTRMHSVMTIHDTVDQALASAARVS